MVPVNHSRCQFCSLGCAYGIEVRGGEALSLAYDGPLCSRGNYLLELINHPLRLTEPSIGGLPALTETAFAASAPRVRRDGDRTSAIILAPEASIEDVRTARAFAEGCVGTFLVAVDDPSGDLRTMRALCDIGMDGDRPTFNDIARAKVILAVGDPFEAGPVIAGPVLDAKYTHGRDMTFAVIDESPNRTSRFAGAFIGGSMRRNLAALLMAVVRLAHNVPPWAQHLPSSLTDLDSPGIGSVADALTGPDDAIVLVDTADPAAMILASLVSAAAGPHVQCLPITSYGNASGIAGDGAADATMEDIVALATSGDLGVLIVLGADITRNPSYAGICANAETVIAASPFPNGTTEQADIVLPAAVFTEYGGTWGDERLEPVIAPPGAARGYGDILGSLAHTMGMQLEAPTPLSPQDRSPDEGKIAAFLETLPETIDRRSPEVFMRNTITRYSDGVLTDPMSWTAAQTREAW